MDQATIVATLTAEVSADALAALPPEVGCLEVRADLMGDPDPEWLRQHFGGKLLYSLRSVQEGGTSTLANGVRRERLLRAAAQYDFVELATYDLAPRTLAGIPPEQRVVTWHGRTSTFDELAARFAQLSSVKAARYGIVPRATHSGDELAPLTLLRRLNRDDVFAYAEGRIATWTHIAALHLGAPWVFGSIENEIQPNGALPIARLIRDYGLPHVDRAIELFGIAGNPVERSLSPRLHNTAFRALRRKALYVAFHVEKFNEFWENLVASDALDALGLPLRAVCVVSPYKAIAVGAANARTPIVQQARSTNFLLREGDCWTADTTDPEGVLVTLRERGVDPARQKVAVIGCGGSGRSIAAALQQAGAEVTLVNRGFDRGTLAIQLLHLPFLPLAGFASDRYSIVVNATPVGGDGEGLPFVVDGARKDAVIVDLVYGARPTPLVASARMAGQVAIDGMDVLLMQAQTQFRLMTGEEMPNGLAQRTLGLESRESSGSRTAVIDH
jgi:3-dehydroquinate dehydratase/shikimate dehydrogenase